MSSDEFERERDRLHHELGWLPLNAAWAKWEIAGGLTASTAGLAAMVWSLAHDAGAWWWLAAGGGLLHILGAYLAMAGHRSHLYQSSNQLAVYLLARLARGERPAEPAATSPTTDQGN